MLYCCTDSSLSLLSLSFSLSLSLSLFSLSFSLSLSLSLLSLSFSLSLFFPSFLSLSLSPSLFPSFLSLPLSFSHLLFCIEGRLTGRLLHGVSLVTQPSATPLSREGHQTQSLPACKQMATFYIYYTRARLCVGGCTCVCVCQGVLNNFYAGTYLIVS